MIDLNPSIFRAYDIRGVAEHDLVTEVVRGLGRALGSRAAEKSVKQIAVGRDIRLSSPRLFEDLTSGINATGVDVVDLGVIPTPVMYFSLHHYDMDTGVMITGSHNPADQNGFKLCEDKHSIFGPSIQELKQRIIEERFTSGEGEMTDTDPVPAWLEYMHSAFSFNKSFKIICDPGNGATGILLEELFGGFCNLDVSYINLEPDGNFPAHLSDPTVPEYMEELGNLVRSEGADLGIGFDGDGDRVGAIDEKGKLLFGDKLLALFASEVIEDNPGAKIIFDVKCSQGIVEYIKDRGGTPVMYKTGHSLLKAKLREEKAPLAGEMSGHVFFADSFFGYDDAMYAALRLLRLLERRDKSLSELAVEVPSYINTPEIHVRCPDEEKFKVIERLQEDFSARYETVTIDGARVIFPDGWGLVRASNTRPVLVLRFEAKTTEALDNIKGLFFEKLKKYGVETEEVK
ncbi:phosphomannomutase [candidate division WOR-3 bacterium]|uniref:Phosphomannomutase n=1 Tax=candidate division WOR-3 bacterium TaxID=2052148 RepID=A0A9D5K813_UNCW3|nr:phosphomannomutase [candidate division WOR-3 bacterium]MBD3363967.1 phosphomannomutase [candidate division WOR-3 bacterium]